MAAILAIVGVGGFGRETAEIVRALGPGQDWSPRFYDDSPGIDNLAKIERAGYEFAGSVGDLANNGEVSHAVVAIGDPAIRRGVVQRLGSRLSYPVLVHREATIGTSVTLREGCVVAAGARLSSDIDVGRHVHVDQNATIGHDTVVADYVRINPQACISGGVHLEELALIGAHATVLPQLRIGSASLVGAGAVVTRDVASGVVVKGVPAR